jgi:hypothetical protein
MAGLHLKTYCDTADDSNSNCKIVNCVNVRVSGINSLYAIRREVICRALYTQHVTIGQWTTCLVSVTLSPCLPIANSSRYMACLLSDVVFTGVVRQCCQSGLLSLETSMLRLSSAHFGSTWHGMEKHRRKGVFTIARMCHTTFIHSLVLQASRHEHQQ